MRALLVVACASLTLGTSVAVAADGTVVALDTAKAPGLLSPLPAAPPTTQDHAASQQSGATGDGADAPATGSDIACLTAAVYYESRGEPAAGQAAVAQVVLNRTRLTNFPETVCGVVYQGVSSGQCQFSFACHGGMKGRREPGAWERSREVAQRALDGYVMPEVSHAAYFHAARLGAIWGTRMTRVRIGQHIFYSPAERAELRRAVRMLEQQAAAPAPKPPATPVAAPQQVAAAAAPSSAPKPTPVATAPTAAPKALASAS